MSANEDRAVTYLREQYGFEPRGATTYDLILYVLEMTDSADELWTLANRVMSELLTPLGDEREDALTRAHTTLLDEFAEVLLASEMRRAMVPGQPGSTT